MNAIIHSYESLAAVDGEGLRYAVFFAGCPLRCVYCHNPDTWIMQGQEVTPNQLVQKIKRYKPYFKDNGGVTFTGGEPMLQAEFIRETIPLLKSENINYTIDTSGMVELRDSVKYVYENAQMVILDFKFPDRDKYKHYTGGSFDKFFETLNYLDTIGKRTWLRTVIIPDINDKKEAIDEYISVIKNISSVEKYELLGFHTMGFYKYDNLQLENPLKSVDSLDKEKLNELQGYLNSKINIM